MATGASRVLQQALDRAAKSGELDLAHNQLTSLPLELAAMLDRGLDVRLEGNPLQEPLPGLVARGFEALAAYLRSWADFPPQARPVGCRSRAVRMLP